MIFIEKERLIVHAKGEVYSAKNVSFEKLLTYFNAGEVYIADKAYNYEDRIKFKDLKKATVKDLIVFDVQLRDFAVAVIDAHEEFIKEKEEDE